VIYILTPETDEPQSDTDIQNPENCTQQQSTLSDQGQIDARSIGASFLTLSIPIGQVMHSGSCNSRATAMLAFGQAEGWTDPNGFSPLLRGERITALREMLSTTPQPGTNTVLVGPGLDITDVTGITFVEGEAAIYKPLGKTGYALMARVLLGGWEQFEHSTSDLVPVEPCVSEGIQLEQVDPGFGIEVTSQSGTNQGDGQVEICRPGQSTASEQELLLPDLITLPPTDLHIRVNQADEQKFLRFTNSIMNIGPGKMELWGASNPETGKVTVTQYVYKNEDATEKVVVGEFFFHPEHNHWHFGDFARYEIWSLGTDGGFDSVVAVGNKISYCLRDDARSDIPGADSRQTYTSCEQERQGISVGWIDIYRYHLDGQSIEITSLPDGVYALRSIVDPEDSLLDINPGNNAAILYIEIEGNSVNVVESPGSLLGDQGE
jgi:hypothetical protein